MQPAATSAPAGQPHLGRAQPLPQLQRLLQPLRVALARHVPSGGCALPQLLMPARPACRAGYALLLLPLLPDLSRADYVLHGAHARLQALLTPVAVAGKGVGSAQAARRASHAATGAPSVQVASLDWLPPLRPSLAAQFAALA